MIRNKGVEADIKLRLTDGTIRHATGSAHSLWGPIQVLRSLSFGPERGWLRAKRVIRTVVSLMLERRDVGRQVLRAFTRVDFSVDGAFEVVNRGQERIWVVPTAYRFGYRVPSLDFSIIWPESHRTHSLESPNILGATSSAGSGDPKMLELASAAESLKLSNKLGRDAKVFSDAWTAVVSAEGARVIHGMLSLVNTCVLPMFDDELALNSSALPWPFYILPSSKRVNGLATPRPADMPSLELEEACYVGGYNHWYHFLIESGRRLRALDQAGIPIDVPLIVPRQLHEQIQNALSRLTKRKLVPLGPFEQVAVETLYVSRDIRNEWRRAMSNENDLDVFQLESLLWVRDRIMESSQYPKSREGTRRTYLSRGFFQTRNLINRSQVANFLGSRGFLPTDTSSLSLDQQVQIMNSSGFIVGEAGAALTNMIFCEPGTQVVELGPGRVQEAELRLWRSLARILELDFLHVPCTRLVPGGLGRNAPMWVHMKQLERAVLHSQFDPGLS